MIDCIAIYMILAFDDCFVWYVMQYISRQPQGAVASVNPVKTRMFVCSYVCSDRNSGVSGRGYKYDEHLAKCVRYPAATLTEG